MEHVEALDLTTGSRSTVFESTFQPGTTMVGLAAGYQATGYLGGAELPPGWFLLFRSTVAQPPLAPTPDYSAAALAGTETHLPFMKTPSP